MEEDPSIWLKKNGYIGNIANQCIWLFAPETTNLKTYIATLDKIQRLPVQRIYCGHNPEYITLENIKLYKRAAVEADYDKEFEFNSPIIQQRMRESV